MLNEDAFIKELTNIKTQETAFKKLLQLYQKPLYNHIRSIVLNHDDADDVLQNTFIKVFSNIKNFKGECKLFSWMYRIATNESLTFLQQKARKSGISNEELKNKLVQNLESDVFFEGSEIQLQLQKAIAILPEKQQLIFKMKYFEALKYEQISEILNTSVGGLKASYHIAVKKIEAFLKAN